MRARTALEDARDLLDRVAEAVIEREILTAEDLEAIFSDAAAPAASPGA